MVIGIIHSLVSPTTSTSTETFDPNNYSSVDYETVARTPDSYKDKKLVFSGTVIQVQEGSSEDDLRVATEQYSSDIIFVKYSPSLLGSTHVLQNDTVTVYGTCLGQYTYISVLGSNISIPGTTADQIIISNS